MLWHKRHYPGDKAFEPKVNPSEVKARLTGDVEEFLKRGGKIKLCKIPHAHKNIRTVSHRLDEIERVLFDSPAPTR